MLVTLRAVDSVLRDGSGALAVEGGTSFVAEVKAGEAIWEPASTHMAENVGGSGTRMVLVEVKDRNWKPATG